MNAFDRNIQAVAPNNVDAECALLGAIFVNNDAFHAVSAFLKPEHFYEPIHRKIFTNIVALISEGKTATPPLLMPYLPVEEMIGDMTVRQYVARLAAEAVTIINARDYGEAIVNEAECRQLVIIGEEIVAEAYNHSPDRHASMIAADGEARLAELRADSPKDEGPGTARAAVEKLRQRSVSNEVTPAITFPLQQLFEVCGGDLEAGNLYGLLSSSGEGKTSLALQIIHHAAVLGNPVLFLSYDQSDMQCIDQMASQITGIENSRIKKRTLMEREWVKYYDALDVLAKLPIVIQKCSREGIGQLGNHARRFMKRYARQGVPIVVLDHVRKVSPRDPKAHEGRISSEINGACKAYAGELGCVWLNLNQRNSAGMKRENPRPISADMFGGEQAKEDYDAILYLYRPDKYKEDQVRTARNAKEIDAINERFASWEGLAEIGALKVRFGDPTQRRKIQFEREYTRYASLREDGAPAFEGMGF